MFKSWVQAAVIVFSVALFLSACDKALEDVPLSDLQLTQEATPIEAERIRATTLEISKIMERLGVEKNLNAVPIHVTSQLNVAGLCQKSASGEPLLIAISKEVLNAPVALPGRTTELFDVLLHEFGHCYFSRRHDDRVIESPGLELVFLNPPGVPPPRLFYRSVPGSIMVSAGGAALPLGLRDYYVAEVVGLARAETVEDLRPYMSVVEREPRENPEPQVIRRWIFDHDH